MPTPPLRFEASIDALRPAFDDIRRELEIDVGFPPAASLEAEAVARSGPRISGHVDRRSLDLISIDPEGARDLDQAVHIERARDGYTVHYAIADVAAFVAPGGAVDAAARARGLTVYLPDVRAPLHPPVLSEGAASLLPDVDRVALLWRFHLDASGEVSAVDVERALVRNRRAWSYDDAQRAVDGDVTDADPTLALLAEIGPKRLQLEADRGGVSLDVPEQVVEADDGHFGLAFRAPLPVEYWNAQISLMTGMVAAQLMLDAGVGILRTLPPAADDDVDVLRRHARALGIDWPRPTTYAELIRSLDAGRPAHAALLAQAARLFRGAGYVAFDETAGAPIPSDPRHAAVAAPYAHVTAPLRRLVDRFANEIVLAVVRGEEPPAWARNALPDLPAAMAEARRREGAADGRAADLVEAAVLSGRVGDVLDAVVVRSHRKGLQVQITDPAVVATVDGKADLGDEVRVRVEGADPERRRVDLAIVS
ncbi:MAG TPA: RNB domain-containing ribonuclease [Acidimicrobiales bacterium]|nr:RNB domain-containing ribonuclease [Acidimicrobiales bacterium]